MITFDASSSLPGSGIIIKHKWSFGDGTYAIGKVVTHSYSAPGVYTVTLNVTNSKGLWSIIQKQIEVVELPGPKAPIANFTYSPLNPTVGQEVTFNASDSYDPDGVIVAYNWDFGDGSSEQGKIVTHYYTQEGSYKVTLTVIDNDGKTGSISQTVTVVKPLDVPVETSGLVIKAMSPVDLVVIDPDYLVISKEFSEIPDAVYMEIDLNGDGSLDDYIFIPEPKMGQYIITVIPEPGADPTATYTVAVATKDATILLAEDVPISQIPTEPYIINPTIFEGPPSTQLAIGEPKYVDPSGNVYVSPTTPFTLTAQDNIGGSGVMATFYRISNETYSSDWLIYAEPFNLTGMVDGAYKIEYKSIDNAGNAETPSSIIVILDNTPPTTTLKVGVRARAQHEVSIKNFSGKNLLRCRPVFSEES
jgi:PKD repeat protein